MHPLVSIIMPAYNAESFIAEAIRSVLNQEYVHWELIIVNDGSRDNTGAVVKSFEDARIQYFEQENKGVSSARNKAISAASGSFLCFLDADDVMPQRSIASRVEKFIRNPDLSFIDGKVLHKNADLTETLKTYSPSFKGQPFDELIQLKDNCLFGNTWMIRIHDDTQYQFTDGLTHAEDLSFYLSISKNRSYDFVDDEVLWYRRTGESAMNNLNGLENGYKHVYQLVKKLGAPTHRLSFLKKRIIRIMMLSWLFDGKNPIQSILSLFRLIRI